MTTNDYRECGDCGLLIQNANSCCKRTHCKVKSAENPKEESEPEAIVELEDYIDSLFFPKDAQQVMHYLKSNFTIIRNKK